MRILLATGINALDRIITNELSRRGLEVVGECYYRESLLSLMREKEVDVVVLSPHLPGQAGVIDLVKELRMAGLRVVLLPGRRDDPEAVDLVRKAAGLDVYDLVWDPVSPAAVVHRVLNPATLAEASVEPDESVVKKVSVQDVSRESKESRKGKKNATCLARKCLTEGKKLFNKYSFSKKHVKENSLDSGDFSENNFKRNNNFLYEVSPYEKKTEVIIAVPQVNIPAKGQRKVIAIASPWVSSGSSTFSALLSKALSKKAKVAVVDCDINGRGLGIRFGLSSDNIPDWRDTDAPVTLQNLALFTLDPSNTKETESYRLIQVINEANRGISWLILDLGSDPKSWWFLDAVKYADVMFWVVNNDPLLLEQAKTRWKTRPKVSCREFMLLFGSGDPKIIEEIFMIPCIQIKSGKDKRGYNELSTILSSNTLRSGKRVLAVGFKELPEIPGVVWDSFKTTNQALKWIEYNLPDMAVLSTGLKKISLLEYDLKKREIPFFKVGDVKEIVDCL